MADAEITTTILRQIRDEIIATRTDLGKRIDATNERLDVTNDRLTIVEHSVRDLAVHMLALTRHVKNGNDDLRKRVTQLEKKRG